jgi:DNA-binding MarR family transcriptional regulator
LTAVADPRDASELDPGELDVVLAALFAGLALNERVTERLRAAGFDDVRFSHGFVFQHLVPGPLPVGELARRMDVSQQAASKATAELEQLGYLERTPDPADARVRRLGLSERGREAIAAGRDARAAVADELGAVLGAGRAARLRRDLLAALEAAGGLDAVRARRVPSVR